MTLKQILAWIAATGIGVALFFTGRSTAPAPTPTPEANQIVGVHYTGHLDLAFHSVCADGAGKIVPCTQVATKASLTEAINWYYASGSGHGVKYYDWQHITYVPAHCGTGDIVEKWLYGTDTHTCACLLTGQTLPCTVPPTPKPGGGTNG